MEFLYLLLILLISFAVHLILNIKAEQSLFLVICSFFIIMLVSGFISNLMIGYYIIIMLALFSAILILYKAVNKQIKITEFITPGISFFVLAYTIYYFSTQGALLHMWDEATHWGTSAKKMFYSKQLWTSGLQTIASPLFNQVMLTTTGYKESALYLSQWTLYLACIALPMSHIKWKKSYLALLYGALAIALVSSVFEDGNLTLYADGILGMMFASLVIAWYLEKDMSFKRFIWLVPGVFMLVQIKSGSGASLSVMLVLFMLISDFANREKDTPKKKIYIKNVITLGITAATIFLAQFSYNALNKRFLALSESSGGLSPEMTKSIFFIALIIVLSVTAILFVMYSINVFKGKTESKSHKKLSIFLIASMAISFVSLISVTFYQAILRPDFDVRTTFINYFHAYEKTAMLKTSVLYLIIIIAVIYIINILLSDKPERKTIIIFYASALFLSGAYLYGVLYAYLTSFSLGEAVNTASFDRYVGTAILFAGLFAFVPLLKSAEKPLKKLLIACAPIIICAALLAIQFRPAYKTTLETSEEAIVFRQTEIQSAEYVKSKIGNEGKVFLVIQGDQGFVFNWMRYEFAPLVTNGGIWSFGLDGGWNFAWTPAQLTEFLNKANYEYLYLFKSNDYMDEQFGDLFGDTPTKSYSLYKFNFDGEPVFELVE